MSFTTPGGCHVVLLCSLLRWKYRVNVGCLLHHSPRHQITAVPRCLPLVEALSQWVISPVHCCSRSSIPPMTTLPPRSPAHQSQLSHAAGLHRSQSSHGEDEIFRRSQPRLLLRTGFTFLRVSEGEQWMTKDSSSARGLNFMNDAQGKGVIFLYLAVLYRYTNTVQD